MISIEISATAVAWYGAILATLSASVALHNAWKNRIRLRVRFAPNLQIADPMSGVGEDRYLIVTIANAGWRPVTVSHLAFLEKRRGDALLDRDSIQPRELTEGKSTHYQCEQSLLDFTKIRYVQFEDSVGGVYRRRFPRRIRNAIAERNTVLADKSGGTP